MTGGGRGWCGGAHAGAEARPRGPGFGLGRGHRFGGGWGHRHCYHATGLTGWERARLGWPARGEGFAPAVAPEQELAVLRQEAARLEQALDQLRARIQGLATPPPAGPKGEHQ